MSNNRTPLTLTEALVRWGEPAAAAEMRRLAEQGCGGPFITLLGVQEAQDVLRYRELREMLERELIEKLRHGTLVASGFDVRAPFNAPAVTIPPDRWRTLVPNFDNSSAADAGVTIRGILVGEELPAPTLPARGDTHRLEMGRRTRRVCLDGTVVRLPPRSFDLLLMLAEAAVAGGAPVPRRDIEARLWSKQISKKAVADAVNKLKGELIDDGVPEEVARLLIENVPSIGYRLTAAPADVLIVD